MSSDLKVTNIKHESSASNNLVLASDGSATIANLDVSSGSFTTSSAQKQTVVNGGLVSAYGTFASLSDSASAQVAVPTITGQTTGSFFSVESTNQIEITSSGLYQIFVNTDRFDANDSGVGCVLGVLNFGTTSNIKSVYDRRGMGGNGAFATSVIPDTTLYSVSMQQHFLVSSTNKRIQVEIFQKDALQGGGTISYYWVINKIGTI